VATFQDIRQFLEHYHNDLTVTLSPGEQTQFQTAFVRLQRDWDTIPDESVKLNVTLREMQKYPTVWKALEDANLVQRAQPTVRTIHTSTSAPATPVASSIAPQPDSTRSPQPDGENHEGANAGQPSQSMINLMAMWDKRMLIGRELITNVLGALIVLVTLVIAIVTIFSVGNASTYAAAKDVLLFMNGLVGVVLGYYFGRVPADARADKAESEAKKANNGRDQVIATVRTVLESSSPSSSRGVNTGVTLTPEQVESLRRVVYKYGE
jgi:hypothetical protein